MTENEPGSENGPDKEENENNNDDPWKYYIYSIFVLLVAVLFACLYVNYSDIRRMDGIIDAVTHICDSTEEKHIRACLKRTLLKCNNGAPVQTNQLNEAAHQMRDKKVDTLKFESLVKRVEQLEAQAEKTSARYAKELKRLSNRLDELSNRCDKATTALEESENSVVKLETNLEDLRRERNNIEIWRSAIERKTEQMRNDHDILKSKTDTITEWTEKEETTVKHLNDNVVQLSKSQQDVTIRAGVLEKGVETLNVNHDNVTKWIASTDTNTTDWIARLENKTLQWLDSLDNREHNLEQFVELSKYQSKEAHNELAHTAKYHPLLMLMVVIVIIWMGGLTLCIKQKFRDAESTTEYHSKVQPNTYRRYTTQTHDPATSYPLPTGREPLRNAVCVIGFHTETERKHRQRVEEICSSIPQPPEVIYYPVHRHDDISAIPGAKVYVMCVDFNERNVILECPNKGLGDIKLLTVRKLWNHGGDVILVYCGDIGSGQLQGNELFNSDLTSIYNHKELTKLKNQERMLSIQNSFTPCQKNHIKRVVSERCCY